MRVVNVQISERFFVSVFVGVSKMFTKSKILACFMAFAPVTGHALTVPLAQGADWTEFRFDINLDGGAWLETADTLEIITFTFSVAKEAKLQVTDAHRSGDQFEVFSNGSSLGLTSATSVVGDDIFGDYTAEFEDDRWSSGEWILGPGDYAITGFVRVMPEERGRGAVRLTGVDLPATLPMLLSAGLVLGVASRRKRSAGAGPS